MRLGVGHEVREPHPHLVSAHVQALPLELLVVGDLRNRDEAPQPLLLVPPLRVLLKESQPLRQLTEDVVVVPGLVQGGHRPAGEEEVVAPVGDDDVVPLQEGRDRQHDVAVLGRRRHEAFVADGELDLVEGPDVLVDVAALDQEVATHVVDGLDVAGVAAPPALQNRVCPAVGGDGSLNRVLGDPDATHLGFREPPPGEAPRGAT
ncbi:hypothetical protein ES703_116348 [subsurface metagenome]